MSRRRTSLIPPSLLPLVTFFAVVFSLAVYVAQKIESPATAILAPTLEFSTDIPVISAPVYLVFDIATGRELLSREADTPVPIASVTKLFAAATLIANFNLQATTTIMWSDIAGGGEAGKLVYGRTYSYQELLFPLLLESSNDAAATLVRSTDGAVITKMNELARAVGASSTTFVDASGLTDGNISTAHDLRRLLTDVLPKHHTYLISPHCHNTSLSIPVGVTTIQSLPKRAIGVENTAILQLPIGPWWRSLTKRYEGIPIG